MEQSISEAVAKHRRPDSDIAPIILNRWSPRSFLDKPVPDEALLSLFEAARWAPSASNEQPWRFITARTEEDKSRWYPFINPGNRSWCERAPVLVLVLSDTLNSKGNPSRFHAFDTGAAWGYMALEGVRQGLITHAMGGFDAGMARQALQIPDRYDIQALLAVGYQGPADVLTEEQQQREKPNSRRPVKESVHEGAFGKPLLEQ